jgi:hypothetical protein
MLHGLRLATYRFSLICTSEMRLRPFPGAVLRSAIGDALRTVKRSAYDYLYETSTRSDESAQNAPRPYVIAPRRAEKRRYHAGEELAFELTLIGERAIGTLEALVRSVLALEPPAPGEEKDNFGLGADRDAGKGRFYLSRVTALAPDGARFISYDRANGTFYGAPATITDEHIMRRAEELPERRATVRFETPIRIVKDGESLRELCFHQFHKALSWRLRSLLRRHCDRPDADFREWVAPSYDVETVSTALAPAERSRYSASQERAYTLEGVTGTATFAGDLTPFRPFLAAGEWLHAGKGYVMGLGRYHVEPAVPHSDPPHQPAKAPHADH